MNILNKLIKETNKIDFLFPNTFEQLMNDKYYDYDKFEWFLYYVFKMNGSNVRKLGKKGQGDGGADLVVSDKLADGGVRRIGIQAKYWKNKVGAGPINQLASAKSRLDLTDLWIITTSDLTTDAKEIAESMDIKILRGEDVTNLIEHVKSVYENDIKDKGDSPIEFIQEEPIKVKTKVEVKNDENTEDTELVKQFKTLRLKLAKEHKMYPLYNVYNNAMIDDVITANPQTKEALANVKGFGPLKVKLFGDAIVKLLKENFDTSNDVTVDNDNDLFQKLIAERAKISKFNKIPVEAIYSDQVAKNLAKMKPKKIEHLDKIFGFDKKNIKIFGEYLVNFISRNS